MNSSETVILGVAASDAHVVANKLIEKLLVSHGYHVVNLGACTTIDEFGEAYAHNKPVLAIVIGSLNGHAVSDMTGLELAKRQYKITCPVILGGNLSVGSQKNESVFTTLYQLGVDLILRDPRELLTTLASLSSQRTQEVIYGVA